MEKLNFRTSSGIKSIVGRDLITDKFVAVFELVKNAYDANATEVIVSFNNIEYFINKRDLFYETSSSQQNNNLPENVKLEELLSLKDDEPHIIIKDNGHGMNRDDLVNKWLYLAYSDKKEGHDNEGRTFVGSKGIGRFSCDTLGETLNIRTKRADENIEHILVINWNEFEKDQTKEFGKINVQYSLRTVNNKDSYTILTIRNLRHHDWHIARSSDKKTPIDLARQQLERLKNPFKSDDGFNIFVGENLSLARPDPNTRIVNNISEIIKGYTTTIEVTISKTINIELYDRGEEIYRLSKENTTVLNNTPIIISIHYLNPTAKRMFTRRMGIEAKNYGNIFIYKNNFRVMPYGDEDIDLFGLNLRKTQGFARNIATRELLGYIEIQDQYHHFKETSSRNNGFVQNIYFKTLEEIYLKDIHTLLERYIHLIKWGEISDTQEEVFFDSKIEESEVEKYKRYITGTKKFTIDSFKDNLNVEENKPEKKLDKIIAESEDDATKVVARDIKKKIVELKEENKQKSTQLFKSTAELKNIKKQNENLQKIRESSSYVEQITHHFKTMAEDLYYTTDDLLELTNQINDEKLKEQLKEKITQVRAVQRELTVFQNLLINTDLDLRSKQKINWFDQAKLFSDSRSNINYGIKITCSIVDEQFIKQWDKICDALQFHIALDNFYQNSKDHGAEYMDILFDENIISFTNDSKQIDEVHLENIFNLGYSTKMNGTGIGLTQIQKFFKVNGYETSLDQDDKHVKFFITKG